MPTDRARGFRRAGGSARCCVGRRPAGAWRALPQRPAANRSSTGVTNLDEQRTDLPSSAPRQPAPGSSGSRSTGAATAPGDPARQLEPGRPRRPQLRLGQHRLWRRPARSQAGLTPVLQVDGAPQLGAALPTPPASATGALRPRPGGAGGLRHGGRPPLQRPVRGPAAGAGTGRRSTSPT